MNKTTNFGLLFFAFFSLVLCGISFASKTATLNAGETEHLKFMREEEKLARDVYLTLGSLYPEVGSFQQHCRIGAKAHRYHGEGTR